MGENKSSSPVFALESASAISSSSSPPKNCSNTQSAEILPQENGHCKMFVVNFLIGGVSASLAKTATAPIERTKLLLAGFTGIDDCLRRVYTEQGLSAFWRGNVTNVIRYFPHQGFSFAFKDSLKTCFPEYSSKKDFINFALVNSYSGGLAAAATQCIMYPLDHARILLAVDAWPRKRAFNGLWDCLGKTIRAAGVPGLYNGLGASLMSTVPYYSVYFGMFDSLAAINPDRDRHGIVGLASNLVMAQAAAITAEFVSYPLDTIRRRLQSRLGLPQREWKYTGMADCYSKILKYEGVLGLYKGAWSGIPRTVTPALVLVFYAEIKTLIGFRGIHGSSD
jgi:solute carrier family 25 (adenine nucleotide translocator) protein 4/5/6/31